MFAYPSNNKQFRRWFVAIRASWRDTRLLFRQFRSPLLVFLITVIGGGLAYYQLSRAYGEPTDTWLSAIYLALTMVFLQPFGEFPHHPVLQIFYFALPVIGLSALAQGLAEFGILLFNRRARSKEWEMAVASTFSNHIILVGLGHLGYRVVSQLHAINEPVVVIELNPSADQISAVQKMGIPVIQDDASRPATLEAAGVERARAIILCTQNDALNLQIAVKARSMKPDIHVVIRIFDQDFAQSLQQQFGFTALSATAMAAPAFAAAAAGVDITNPITIEGKPLSLVRLKVKTTSKFVQQNVEQIERTYDVSVVMLKDEQGEDFHPTPNRIISSGATLVILGKPERLSSLVHDS
ncbi:MAG: NAD-binding protein [Anaerolineales bacterium]|nr:NAD-binding protein [Anaerolineales bacterium]MCX7607954.1 NAD-binding protein [Anaerolineales bacterium]MDW8228027.1 NAD-binding protein [Anaerolineales bacterium]